MAVQLAVTGDVLGGILFCVVIFPRDVLDEIWDKIVSTPKDFPSYFYLALLPHIISKQISMITYRLPLV